jgi:hypothetical protein
MLRNRRLIEMDRLDDPIPIQRIRNIFNVDINEPPLELLEEGVGIDVIEA